MNTLDHATLSYTVICVLCKKHHERDAGSYVPALMDRTTRKITQFFFVCDDCVMQPYVAPHDYLLG